MYCRLYCTRLLWVVIGTGLSFLISCTPPNTESESNNPGETLIELNKSDDRRLLAYYVGGMLNGDAGDPFEAGFIRENNGDFFLQIDSVVHAKPSLRDDLLVDAADGRIDWTEFESLILKNYYAYRSLPQTTDELKSVVGDWTRESEWFSFGVNGVMSPHMREIHVRYPDLFAALSEYPANGARLLYPVGTVFISDHVDGDRIVEVSAMMKRADGFWDFFAYDEEGVLTGRLKREPRDLDVPTKCIGCHFGTRLFEPERSFPAEASPGPDGPRALYIQEVLPGPELIAFFDEHRKRSDLVLGLYGTLLVNKLKRLESEGELSSEQIELLQRLGI